MVSLALSPHPRGPMCSSSKGHRGCRFDTYWKNKLSLTSELGFCHDKVDK